MLKKHIHIPADVTKALVAAGLTGTLEIHLASTESDSESYISCGPDVIAEFPRCITPGGKFLHNKRIELFVELLLDSIAKEKLFTALMGDYTEAAKTYTEESRVKKLEAQLKELEEKLALSNNPYDRVHTHDGKWYFYDEDWERVGPYETEGEAAYEMYGYMKDVTMNKVDAKFDELDKAIDNYVERRDR